MSITNKKAFTLIEMLVVVVIIGILAAIALPKYQFAMEKSRASQMFVLMKKISNAVSVCWLARGKDSTLCGPDQFDIEIHDKNGQKITNANISKNNQSPTMINDYIGVAWANSGHFFIVRTPYATHWYFDIVISPEFYSHGCTVRTHSSHPGGVKLANAFGYDYQGQSQNGWMFANCF